MRDFKKFCCKAALISFAFLRSAVLCRPMQFSFAYFYQRQEVIFNGEFFPVQIRAIAI